MSEEEKALVKELCEAAKIYLYPVRTDKISYIFAETLNFHRKTRLLKAIAAVEGSVNSQNK